MPGRPRGDRLELAADVVRGVRLQVEAVVLGQPAGEEDVDDRLRGLLTRSLRLEVQTRCEVPSPSRDTPPAWSIVRRETTGWVKRVGIIAPQSDEFGASAVVGACGGSGRLHHYRTKTARRQELSRCEAGERPRVSGPRRPSPRVVIIVPELRSFLGPLTRGRSPRFALFDQRRPGYRPHSGWSALHESHPAAAHRTAVP